MIDAAQTLITGVILGCLYMAVAMGLSLTMGILGLINVAHSAFLVWGSLLTWQLVNGAGLDPILAAVLVVPLFFVVGLIVSKAVINRIAREGQTTGLLVLFGVMVAFEAVAIMVWTTDTRSVTLGYLSGSFNLGPFFLPKGRVVGALIAVAATTSLHLYLQRTLSGRSILAFSQNPDVASMVGIDVQRTRTLVFGLSAALAGLGGALLTFAFSFNPQEHVRWLAWAFLIVIIGGLGSVRNTAIAAIAIGLIEAIAGSFLPFEYVNFVVYALLAGTLLIRGRGLMTATERTM